MYPYPPVFEDRDIPRIFGAVAIGPRIVAGSHWEGSAKWKVLIEDATIWDVLVFPDTLAGSSPLRDEFAGQIPGKKQRGDVVDR